LVQHLAAIALVEGIEHGAVPYVQPILQSEIDQPNADHRERQNPSRAPTAFAPESQRPVPKTCDEILSGLLVVVLSHRLPFFRAIAALLRERGLTWISESPAHDPEMDSPASSYLQTSPGPWLSLATVPLIGAE